MWERPVLSVWPGGGGGVGPLENLTLQDSLQPNHQPVGDLTFRVVFREVLETSDVCPGRQKLDGLLLRSKTQRQQLLELVTKPI